MLKGRVKNVYVNVEIMKITPELEGNYLEDKQYKHDFTMHVRDLWDKKDKLLDKMHADYEESLRKQSTYREMKVSSSIRQSFFI